MTDYDDYCDEHRTLREWCAEEHTPDAVRYSAPLNAAKYRRPTDEWWKSVVPGSIEATIALWQMWAFCQGRLEMLSKEIEMELRANTR